MIWIVFVCIGLGFIVTLCRAWENYWVLKEVDELACALCDDPLNPNGYSITLLIDPSVEAVTTPVCKECWTSEVEKILGEY